MVRNVFVSSNKSGTAYLTSLYLETFFCWGGIKMIRRLGIVYTMMIEKDGGKKDGKEI